MIRARFSMLSPPIAAQGFLGNQRLLSSAPGPGLQGAENTAATTVVSEDAGRFCGDRQESLWRVIARPPDGAGPGAGTRHAHCSRPGRALARKNHQTRLTFWRNPAVRATPCPSWFEAVDAQLQFDGLLPVKLEDH